jgi:hypothetical protein
MAQPRLYVKTKRTRVITGHVSVEIIGQVHTTSEYTEGSTLAKLSQDDALAKDLLRKARLRFDLVDLSDGIGTRLAARLNGVTQTPTLLDRNSPSKLHIGLKEISRYISSNQPGKEN